MEQVSDKHSGHGFYIALISLAIGVLIGGFMVMASEGSKAKEAEAKFQKDLANVKGTVEQAWGDGVMWGALAMKNMSDAKQDTKEFETVFEAAKNLKAQFATQNVPPHPVMLSTPAMPVVQPTPHKK